MIEWRLLRLQKFKELRVDEWFRPLIELENILSIRFSNNLLSGRLKYEIGRQRYFIFTMDLAKYLKVKGSYDFYYIHNLRYCNKRKNIGNIINRLHLKVIIVYYSTSKKFRLYIHFGSELVRLSIKQLKAFNVYNIIKMLKSIETKKKKKVSNNYAHGRLNIPMFVLRVQSYHNTLWYDSNK